MRSIVNKTLITLALATLALTGCATKKQPEQEQTPITLRFGVPFQNSRADRYFVEAVERYQQEHPHITVEVEPLASSSGVDAELFDSLQIDAFLWIPDSTLVEGQEGPSVLSLDPFIAGWNELDEDAFFPDVLNAFRRGRELYALPADLTLSLMYYNGDMFDAQGAAYPQPDWTWQDFLSTAQQLTTIEGGGDSQTGHWGFVSHPTITSDVFMFVLQHGGVLVDDSLEVISPVFDDPRLAEAIQWYADLGLVYKIMPVALSNKVVSGRRFPMDMFSLQEAAMIIGNPNDHYRTDIPWDFEWGVAPLPRDRVGATFMSVRGFYIAARTRHPQEAWNLVRALSESESGVFSWVPARRAQVESDAFRQRMGADMADAVLYTLDHSELTQIYGRSAPNWIGTFMTQLYWVTSGDILADEMMDHLQEEFADQ